MKLGRYSYLAASSTIGVATLALLQGAQAQQTQQPGVAQLPPVNVIQEQPKPTKTAPKKTVTKKKTPVAPAPVAAQVEPEPQPDRGENSIRLSPLAGSEVPLEKVPGAVSRVTSESVERSGSPAVEEVLQLNVPGVIVSDLPGSSFQTDVQYRGFTSSPVNGSPQGLAVYQNGVRINEVFGDTVNWDMIPSAAIDSITVISGNPVFGLNAVGGAISIEMKDGFKFQGVESDTRVGSYGRIQETLQGGVKSGNMAAYIAMEGINDDGFRDFSSSRVRRLYGDVGVKNKGSEFHLNVTGAHNYFGVAGPSPIDLLDQSWSQTFTTPHTTKNDMQMLSANGKVDVSPALTLSGVLYVRRFKQKQVHGGLSEVAECADHDFLCLGDEPLFDANGDIHNPYGDDDHIGSVDRTSVDAKSFGGTLQASSKAKLFGHGNQLTMGISADHGSVKSTSASELGVLDPSNYVVTGLGVFPYGPDGIQPVGLKTKTDYIGLYVADTFDLTQALSLTAGGRFNYANLNLKDDLGNNADLTGEHTYTRFNPMAGLTYKVRPGLSFYGSYSEANRAPTPAELACSDPEKPCLLENFLVSDPDLKQVVSHNWEAGLRGDRGSMKDGGKVEWRFGLFHTLNEDDIISVASPIQQGRGYFLNAGDTLRQGVEASISYRTQRLFMFANYAYTDATFHGDLNIASPNNPSRDENDEIHVHKGDHIPAIPAHRLKLGIDYNLTEKWKIGGDVIVASNQYYVGDESNENAKLPGYAVVNLHTSYQIAKNVQLYGLVNNVFDEEYATYGTYVETGALGINDARTMTPAQPLSVYGGLKVKF